MGGIRVELMHLLLWCGVNYVLPGNLSHYQLRRASGKTLQSMHATSKTVGQGAKVNAFSPFNTSAICVHPSYLMRALMTRSVVRYLSLPVLGQPWQPFLVVLLNCDLQGFSQQMTEGPFVERL